MFDALYGTDTELSRFTCADPPRPGVKRDLAMSGLLRETAMRFWDAPNALDIQDDLSAEVPDGQFVVDYDDEPIVHLVQG